MYQAFRQIISIWRPFYTPDEYANDQYMQMAVLKNDLGELAKMEFNWQGKTGNITEMDDAQRDNLYSLLDAKEQKKQAKKKEDWT